MSIQIYIQKNRIFEICVHTNIKLRISFYILSEQFCSNIIQGQRLYPTNISHETCIINKDLLVYFRCYTFSPIQLLTTPLEYFLKPAFKITEIGDYAIQMNNFFKNDQK